MISRNRAWRRFRREVKINDRDLRIYEKGNLGQEILDKGKLSKTKGVPEYRIDHFKYIEKNWKMMYLRKNKLARAKQLGRDYPPKTIRQILDDETPIDIER